ncbi:MAG: flagellar biosynthesis protein FliQ [Rhodospirillales bacterium]|nr:flagellar biosynthesis protein FliQ [Alphaproteobacteria bacterium]MBL6947972.1 flagellar biosynthesis protein FliQ [Rhodospirillales bacterium]
MDEASVLEIGRNGIWVVLKLSAPIMGAGLLIGLVIALFQALTTIQEMTLTFVPKIVVIFFSILLFLPFMMTTLIEFSQELFGLIVTLG